MQTIDLLSFPAKVWIYFICMLCKKIIVLECDYRSKQYIPSSPGEQTVTSTPDELQLCSPCSCAALAAVQPNTAARKSTSAGIRNQNKWLTPIREHALAVCTGRLKSAEMVGPWSENIDTRVETLCCKISWNDGSLIWKYRHQIRDSMPRNQLK